MLVGAHISICLARISPPYLVEEKSSAAQGPRSLSIKTLGMVLASTTRSSRARALQVKGTKW